MRTNSLCPLASPRVQIMRMTQKTSEQERTLTSLGLSLRYWTTVRRNSSWEILIPLMWSSCSDSAKNMQFPSPWLSEITKPFSKAILSKFNNSWVLLASLRASSLIFWSSRKTSSPANDREEKSKMRKVISHQFNIAFSHDVMSVILVFQKKGTAAMLVFQTNPVGVEFFSYKNTLFCCNKLA